MKVRYFLDDKGGIKVSTGLSKKTQIALCESLLRSGMREVTREEWRAAQKKWNEKSE